MPTYEYQCGECGNGFAVRKSLEQRHSGDCCPACGEAAARVLITPPALRALPEVQLRAHEINERSAHAPRSSLDRVVHGAGCGCCGNATSTSAKRTPDGKKSFPTRRPWMISH